MFGVTNETKSNNSVSYDSGGFKKAILKEVSFEEVGKDVKYKVLSFKFVDEAGIKTFTHSEFPVDMESADAAKRMEGLNVRLKHLYTAFAPFKEFGTTAKNFDEFFQQTAEAFNTGNEGTPIYKTDKGFKSVWLKLGYYSKKNPTNIGFPLSPNFIEGITGAENSQKPKSLAINNKYDIIEQPKTAQPNGGVMGAGNPGIHTGTGGDNEF